MKAIFGLGNPGLKYKFTKHNIGFLVCQELARRHNIKIKKRLYKALVGKGHIDKKIPVEIILPQTYMNNSGQSMALFLKVKKINLADLLVVCDDINLPIGVIRIRKSGSGGGHNGLLSIIDVLKTQDVARLRVGIGSDGLVEEKKDFVLSPFKKDELKKTIDVVDRAADACEVWAISGIDAAMNRFNKKPKD